MKRIILVITMILAIILVPATTLSASSSRHHVSGSGKVTMTDLLNPEDYYTISFNAMQTDTTGAAKGNGRMYCKTSDGTIIVDDRVDIRYLKVDIATGTAWMGVVITASNDPTSVNMEMVWEAVDRGKGAESPAGADLFEDRFRPAADALSGPDIFGTEMGWFVTGNVQVR